MSDVYGATHVHSSPQVQCPHGPSAIDTPSDPVVRANAMLLNDAGSIPTVNIFITCLGVVNLMEKLLSHAQINPATSKQMQRGFPLKQQLSHPPTHPPQKRGVPALCTFPKIRVKPDKPTHPSSNPPPPPPRVQYQPATEQSPVAKARHTNAHTNTHAQTRAYAGAHTPTHIGRVSAQLVHRVRTMPAFQRIAGPMISPLKPSKWCPLEISGAC